VSFRALTAITAVLGVLAALSLSAVSVAPQVRPVVFGTPLPSDPTGDGPPDDNAPTPALLSEKLHEFFDHTYTNLYTLVTDPCPSVRRACQAPIGDVFDYIPKRDQVRALGPVSFTVTDVVPADLPTKPGVDANVNITGPPPVAGITHPCEFRLENNSWKLKYTDAYDLLSIMSNTANAR
jgi:hypothetical protein